MKGSLVIFGILAAVVLCLAVAKYSPVLWPHSNKPISFYGVVYDQHGDPVSDAKVTFSIRWTKMYLPGLLDDVFDYPVTVTDTKGRFALIGARGALLSVKAIEKHGFEVSEKSINRAHYWYWADPRAVFHPDTNAPEVFRMWKKSGAVYLIRHGIGPGLRTDGSATVVDLLEGSVVRLEDPQWADHRGDIRISLVRNPQLIKWGQTNYDWAVTIEAIGGGLLESQDEQMYEAPPEGYQSKIVVGMHAKDPEWTDQKDVNVYLRLRDGKYFGRLALTFMVGADRQITPFGGTVFVNPTGSRNLEYDPRQTVIGHVVGYEAEGKR